MSVNETLQHVHQTHKQTAVLSNTGGGRLIVTVMKLFQQMGGYGWELKEKC